MQKYVRGRDGGKCMCARVCRERYIVAGIRGYACRQIHSCRNTHRRVYKKIRVKMTDGRTSRNWLPRRDGEPLSQTPVGDRHGAEFLLRETSAWAPEIFT